MKQLLSTSIILFLLFANCNKINQQNIKEETNKTEAPAQRLCKTYEVFLDQLKADPSLQQRMDEIESFTARYMKNPAAFRLLADGTLEVPVVVNVLYNNAAENISDLQIGSQIKVMNEDFSATNNDLNKTSTYNDVKSGDIKIKFVLQQTVRKYTTVTTWGTNDAMKRSSRGGIDPTNPKTTLNIWVCTMGGGILGYAQFPGGNSKTDGLVILNTAFGTKGSVEAPFDKGRTVTHELGHYFNLRHIWGDKTCGTDYVDDTPFHDSPNFGCPPAGHLSNCKGTPVEMTMNYMDYTDDACMYMFTQKQALRMQATFAAGGPRESLQ